MVPPGTSVGLLAVQEGYSGCCCVPGLGISPGFTPACAALSRSRLHRYQSGQLNSPKAVEMLELNGNEEERVVMNPSIAAMGTKEIEKLSLTTLFNPPSDTPTALSGRIVYTCVSVIGE